MDYDSMSDAERDALDIQADLKRLVDDEGDVLSRAALIEIANGEDK